MTAPDSLATLVAVKLAGYRHRSGVPAGRKGFFSRIVSRPRPLEERVAVARNQMALLKQRLNRSNE